MAAEDVKESEWDQLLSQDGLIAAYFWATCCPFCMKLKPVFEQVSNDFADVKFVKVNVQEEQKGSDKLRYSLPQCLHSFINFIEL